MIYKNKEVAYIQYRKSIFNVNEEYEILKYETVYATIVDNGLQTLIDAFNQQIHPKSIVVFIDRRWNDGREFLNCGFKFDAYVQPMEWWFNKRNLLFRYNKYVFKKDIASSIINEKFDGNP